MVKKIAYLPFLGLDCTHKNGNSTLIFDTTQASRIREIEEFMFKIAAESHHYAIGNLLAKLINGTRIVDL